MLLRRVKMKKLREKTKNTFQSILSFVPFWARGTKMSTWTPNSLCALQWPPKKMRTLRGFIRNSLAKNFSWVSRFVHAGRIWIAPEVTKFYFSLLKTCNFIFIPVSWWCASKNKNSICVKTKPNTFFPKLVAHCLRQEEEESQQSELITWINQAFLFFGQW